VQQKGQADAGGQRCGRRRRGRGRMLPRTPDGRTVAVRSGPAAVGPGGQRGRGATTGATRRRGVGAGAAWTGRQPVVTPPPATAGDEGAPGPVVPPPRSRWRAAI